MKTFLISFSVYQSILLPVLCWELLLVCWSCRR